MREVPRPMSRPFHCAILPFVGQTHPTARWVRTGSTLENGWDDVYLSDLGLVEACKTLGLPTPPDFAQVRAQLAQATAEVTDLQRHVVELEAALLTAEEQLGAVHVLKQAGYQASRKPGRPPKERVA